MTPSLSLSLKPVRNCSHYLEKIKQIAMASGDEQVMRNKQVILRAYVTGFPKESDMQLRTTSTITLKLPQGSTGVLVKNLYLSCDPATRTQMQHSDTPSSFRTLTPGSVSQFLSAFIRFLFFCSVLQTATYVPFHI